MNIQVNQENEMIRKKVRDFAESKIFPISATLDANSTFPEDIVKELGEMNILGIPFPTEYGGAGKDILSYIIAVEELSRVDGGVGVILSAHVSLGSWPIFNYGTDAQKEKYLTPLASGKSIGAFGLTEYNAGSDAGGTETTAVLDGDHYILNGSKIFITNAPYADFYVVFAITTPGIGTKGISAFIVEKAWDGFTFGMHYDKMGIRSSSTAELIFKDVKVPKENLLGEEGQGFKIAMQTLDGGRIGIAAQALGIAQGAYEQAVSYAKNREQFHAPLSSFQHISFKIADMATKIHAARLMIYNAATLKNEHQPYGTESAMAKMFASDICLEVVNDSLQIHGGYGFIKGLPIERMYRDAKICTIYEGTNEIQRVVIAHSVLGSQKKSANKKEEKKASTRKNIIIKDGSAAEKASKLASFIKEDAGYKKDIGLDVMCAVGLGLKKKEDLQIIEELATALGAKCGCSRPFAEENQWMPMDKFIGVSGQKFKGDIYLAVGISGAIQHLFGIKEAKNIIAINTDENAPIFKEADFGVVGDMYEILPLLIQNFK